MNNKIDVNNLTPIEALNIIVKLKQLIEEQEWKYG